MTDKMSQIDIISDEGRYGILGEMRKDICFQHAIFAQCFLPIKPLPKGTHRFQTNHGKASLVLNAGEIKVCNKRNLWEQREIPYGSIGRLIFAYINNLAIRTNSKEIDLCKNINQFINKFHIQNSDANFQKISRGGTTYRQIEEQMKNVCASLINVGVWGETVSQQRKILISNNIEMWAVNDIQNGKSWQEIFYLSQDYFDVLQMHKVPLPVEAIIALVKTPRALDLFMWLCYRLRTLTVPVFITYKDLMPIFGSGFTGDRALENFRLAFRKSLELVHQHYPEAVISPEKEGLRLHPSPSPVSNDGIISKAYFVNNLVKMD